MCYQVMIVEDDPMVAAINKKYTETVPGFRVAGVFRNGAEGLEYLRGNHVDLVILDYYMPEMNGDVFMDRIREEGIQVSVIMVTSANSADTVRSLLLKGVRDYLIKPFELERFQAALERFRSNKELLTGAGSGAIGIEAVSRGAQRSYLVERDRRAIACIEANVHKTHLEDQIIIMKTDVLNAVHNIHEKQVDVIYLDPPYEAGLEEPVLRELSRAS